MRESEVLFFKWDWLQVGLECFDIPEVSPGWLNVYNPLGVDTWPRHCILLETWRCHFFSASSHQESSFELRCCCFTWIPFSGLLAASDLSLERVTHKLHEASCFWQGPLVEWNSHHAEMLINKGTKTWEAHCLVSVMSKRKGISSHFLQMIQGPPSSP